MVAAERGQLVGDLEGGEGVFEPRAVVFEKRRRFGRLVGLRAPRFGPAGEVDGRGEQLGRNAVVGQSPQGDAGEEVERAVVDVVVGRMRQHEMRGPEIADHVDQVVEDVFTGVGGAGRERVVVGHGVGAGEGRAIGRHGPPVVVPHHERAGIGIAQEHDVGGGQAQLGGGGQGFVLAQPARGAERSGRERGMPAGEQRGEFVVVAHGEETDADGQVEGAGFLDQSAGGEGFVVGVGGQHEEAFVVAQQQGFTVGRGVGRGGAGQQAGGQGEAKLERAERHVRRLRAWLSGKRKRRRPAGRERRRRGSSAVFRRARRWRREKRPSAK